MEDIDEEKKVESIKKDLKELEELLELIEKKGEHITSELTRLEKDTKWMELRIRIITIKERIKSLFRHVHK